MSDDINLSGNGAGEGASLTNTAFWDVDYSNRIGDYDPKTTRFRILFDRYLRPRLKKGMSCFEVGCFPGIELIFFAREYGLRVSGIDFSSNFDRMKEQLRRHGVAPEKLYNEDFLKCSIDGKYDLVSSYGFVEHFGNFEQVINRHIDLVSPGGMLFISCPNLNGFPYLLHRIFVPEILGAHNRGASDLHAWDAILRKRGMEMLYHGYYATFRYWAVSKSKNRINQMLINHASSLSRIVDKRIDLPNPLTSPYLVSISVLPP